MNSILSGGMMGSVLGQLGGPPAVDVEKLAQQMRSTADKWRKTASQEAFEELTTEPPDDSLAIVEDAKADSVQDEELFKIAEGLPGDTFETYEALGGKYKAAFGQPMFQMQSMQQPAGGGAAMGAMPGQQTAIKPIGPLKSPTAGGIAGAGGAGMKPLGQGSTNPMQQASTAKIPGAQGQGTQ